MKLTKRLELRVLALIAVFALVAAACTSGDDDTTTTTAAPSGGTEETTTTAAPSGGTEETTTTAAPAVEGFVYTMGMTSDVQSDNFWAYINQGSVYDQYVLEQTKPALFVTAYPGIVIAPQVADGLPVAPVAEGDVFTITQPMRTDYQWEDGTPVTANDVVFTFTTVRDAAIGGDWLSAYPYSEESSPRLTNVEAVDDFTVKFTFDTLPGGAVWPNNVGVADIMPAGAWGDLVASALNTEDPGAVILGADPLEVGDLSAGPVIYAGREEGAFLENVANTNYTGSGTTHTWTSDGSYIVNGNRLYGEGGGDVEVEYAEGPYLARTAFSLYGDQAAAMLALTDGEIDYWVNPLGVSPGLREQGLASENLAVTVNPTNGFRYIAFNMRKSPGKYQGYRQAVAYMIDKEFLTKNVLQGVAFPLYVLVPEGNQAWYNEEVAEEISAKYVGLSEQERLNLAYAALEGDGFSWATAPATCSDEDVAEENCAAGDIVTPGQGLTDPDGTLLPTQEVMAPPASYDPLRATAALWIEGWMEQLGVDAKANPTDFNTIIAAVWPGVGEEITFDTYILGWSLGNAAWPTFHESFFHSRNLPEVNDGSNTPAYIDEEFDALADAMFAETDQAKAFEAIWVMEQKLADDLPYVVLFDTPITEFYSTSLEFPYTQTLSGLQFQSGLQGDVVK